MEDERVLIVEKINNTLKVIWGVFIIFFLKPNKVKIVIA
jgi:hypothetical protein